MELIEPFELNKNIKNELKHYNKIGIIVVSGRINYDKEISQGMLYYVKGNNDLFLHDCNTIAGFSGCPIILIDNLKVIGIHRGYDKNNKKNIGIYFHSSRLNKKNAYKIIINKVEKQNLINCLIDIKDNKDNWKMN